MSYFFINNHTHATQLEFEARSSDHSHSNYETIAIQSLFYQLELPDPHAHYVTIGIHPLQPNVCDLYKDLESDYSAFYASFIEKIESGEALAIGECGFDKSSPLSWTEQAKLFQVHIECSEQLHMPLIFHNVGGTDHIVRMRKESGAKMPWVLHGFRKHENEAKQLAHLGITLSFTPTLIHPDRLKAYITDGLLWLLETDDRDIRIGDEYLYLAKTLEVELNEIIETTRSHFEQIYFNRVGENMAKSMQMT